jgi:hypothetical protein
MGAQRGSVAPLERRARPLVAACFIIPAGVLIGSYVWLAMDRGTAGLWNVVVHESGRYTLGQTLFYVAHFLREVPTDIAYALFTLAATGGFGTVAPDAAPRGRQLGWFCLAAAVVLCAVALIATAGADGWSSAFMDLFQFRTRDDVAAYGSHWRFHWLSTLWFGAVVGLAPVVARMAGRPVAAPHRGMERAAWAYFLAFTAVFGISADVFVDTRYVGHQAREILTHGPVTVLLGVGVMLTAIARLGATRREAGGPSGNRGALWARVGLGIAIPVYLAVVALSGDVMAAGQSDRGLAAMVAAHYFEHALDYLLVALLVLGGFGLLVAHRATRRDDERSVAPARSASSS